MILGSLGSSWGTTGLGIWSTASVSQMMSSSQRPYTRAGLLTGQMEEVVSVVVCRVSKWEESAWDVHTPPVGVSPSS